MQHAKAPASSLKTVGYLGLLVQGDVGHLLARVEQGVLGRLGEHILCGAHKDGGHEGREAEAGEPGREGPAAQHEAEEGKAGDEEDGGGDEGGGAPAKFAEDVPREEHHDKGDGAGGGREVAHEGAVLVGVGELHFDLALPGHLHKVDADAVRDHLQ